MKPNKTRKIFSPISIFVLTCAFLSIWTFIFLPEKHRLEVSYFDVGQGDSFCIEFPDGKIALIDGGPDKKVLEGLGKNLPFYRRKVDIIFLSHPHADHVTGLIHVLNRYQVGRVVLTGAVHTTPEYQEFLRLVKEKNIPVTKGVRGTEFDFSGGNTIKILYPDNDIGTDNLNNTSEVLMLGAGKTRFLFMGDLEKDGSEYLTFNGSDLHADVLKVPHHGSRNALNEDLYKIAGLKYAVVSAGKDNKYGHPHEELIQFLNSTGIKYFRTDRDGEIDFVSDGEKIWKK